jgi:hypothetical protein
VTELFTEAEVEARLREEVSAAGGAKKWLKKNKVAGCSQVLHMIEDGRGATLGAILPVLGFKRVVRYEPINSDR